MISALVVEDDRALRRVISHLLAGMDFDVREAGTVREAEAELKERPDLVLLDLRLPDGHGRSLLDRCRALEPWVPVIVISGTDDLKSMVSMFHLGAYDYVLKPPDLDALREVIDRALTERRGRVSPLRPQSRGSSALVGRSPAIVQVFKQVAHVSASDVTVLITGETGSGKELVARAIHAASDRRDAPFIAVNCAALSRELLSSEMFGHARGAFTGATDPRAGRFEVVGRGTLFLDEIGEMDEALQASLLRVLQERVFERVGETRLRTFEGRIIAATNRDLSAEIDTGAFRPDLYYRLCVFAIRVPPLRERMEDAGRIVRALVPVVAEEVGVAPVDVPDEIIERLLAHTWPGNVRELRNLLQRLTVMSPGATITEQHLVRAGFRSIPGIATSNAVPSMTLAELEADHIGRVLDATGWHKRRSAEILGISRPTLDRKIRAYRLQRRA